MNFHNLLKRLLGKSKRSIPEPQPEHVEDKPVFPAEPTAAVGHQPADFSKVAARASAPIRREAPAASPLIPVVIGLDFGTFSTKVVARRRNEHTATVLCLDEPCAGYPSFAIPSLVRVSQDSVFFGRCAAQADGGQLFRSLKVSLLRSCRNIGAPSPGDDPLEFDRLVALYLAWVLGRVGKWIQSEYDSNRTNVFLNAAAPMDHYEDPALRERYLRIVSFAWNAVLGPRPVGLEQGTALSSVRPWLDEYLDPQKRIEPIETRRFDVLPETVAPIVSLSRDPQMKAGMQLIVDMGAGTTEFSVNHASEPGGDQRILCYHDQSILLGAEQFESPPPGESEYSLTSSLLAELCKTWGKGYRKDADNLAARHRWKELTVLLAGGGTSRPQLRDKIARHQNAVMYAFQGLGCRYSIKTHVPADLDFRSAEAERRTNGFLLSVAHGLSFPRRTWPDFVEPHDVEPLMATPRAGTRESPWFEVG